MNYSPDPAAKAAFDAPAPVRSPRTSIILAELARQRRLERSKRRFQRRQWRRGWAQVTARPAALGHWIRSARGPFSPGRSLQPHRLPAAG